MHVGCIFELDELIVCPPALFNPNVNVPDELLNDEKSPTTSTVSSTNQYTDPSNGTPSDNGINKP